MRKTITAILLGILLISAFGAIIVSAVALDNTGANYSHVPGFMHRWAARNAGSEYGSGNFSYCPYYGTDENIELEVETLDKAFEIAKSEIDDSVSRNDIYQMGRWWIVYYEDEDGVNTQARIDAVTGEVFTGYDIHAGCQAGARHGAGPGYSRGSGHCMGYGR